MARLILYAVFLYVRYGVSYRDFEEIMEERGVNIDHATLNRWVIRYAPTIAAKAHSQKRNTNRSWRMDETYIKVKGKWVYWRAILPHETLGTPVARCQPWRANARAGSPR
jgi:putative transposase